MPNGISWNNVNANLSDAASFANAAQQGISSAGNLFGGAVTNLREREKMILDNAYRDRALEESIRQFDAKFGQDERFHANEMDYKNRALDVEESLGRERNRISWGELGYKNRALSESIRQFNLGHDLDVQRHNFNIDKFNQEHALNQAQLNENIRQFDANLGLQTRQQDLQETRFGAENTRLQDSHNEQMRQNQETRNLNSIRQIVIGRLSGDPSNAGMYTEELDRIAKEGGVAGNAARALLATTTNQWDQYRSSYQENSINAPVRTFNAVMNAIGLGDPAKESEIRSNEYKLKLEASNALQKTRNESFSKASEKLNDRENFDPDRAQQARIVLSNLDGELSKYGAVINADAFVDLLKSHRFDSYWKSSKGDLSKSPLVNAIKNGLRSGQLLHSKTPLSAQQLNDISKVLSLDSFASQSMYGDDVAQALAASQQAANSNLNSLSDDELLSREQIIRNYGRQANDVSDTTRTVLSNPERASRLAPFVANTSNYEPTPEEVNARNLARSGFSYQQQRELRNDINEAQRAVNSQVLNTWAASDDGERLSKGEIRKLKNQRHGYRPSAEEVGQYKPSDIDKATNITVSRMSNEQLNETYPLLVEYYSMMSQLERTSQEDLEKLMKILRQYKREMDKELGLE